MAKYRADSLYRNTKVVSNQYLDTLDLASIDIDNTSTKTVTIQPKHEEKPDLLAYDLYGNAKLWWVFAEYNPDILVDPIIDFVGGMKITVPTRFG